MSTEGVFQTSLTGLLVVYLSFGLTCGMLGLIVAFYSRRKMQPIASRFWIQSIIIAIYSLVFINFESVIIEFPDISCQIRLLALFIGFNIPVLFLLRTILVVATYEQASAYKAMSIVGTLEDVTHGTSPSKYYFGRHARLLKSAKFQVGAFIIMSAVHLSCWAILSFTDSNCSSDDITFFLVMMLGLYGIAILFLIVRLRKLSDLLYLHREIKLIGLTTLVTIVIYFLVRYVIVARAISYCILILGCFMIVAVVIAFPLFLTFKWESQEKVVIDELRETPSSTQSEDTIENVAEAEPTPSRRTFTSLGNLEVFKLRNVLADPDGRAALKSYAALRFAHENVLFYNASTNLLREHPSLEEIKDVHSFAQGIRNLFYTYIYEKAPLQINVSGAVVQRFIKAKVNTIDNIDVPEAFEALIAVRSEVYQLIELGLFPGFLRHDLYKEFVQKKKEQREAARNV